MGWAAAPVRSSVPLMASGAPTGRQVRPADPHGEVDLLRTAAHVGRVGGWAVYVPGSAIYWSEQIFEALDWPDRDEPSVDDAIALYRPAHQPVIRSALERCAADGTPFDIEVALETPRGRTVWARVVGAAEYDEDGTLVRIAGAFQDVTALKAAQTEAQRLGGLLASTLEGMTDAFLMLDPEWRVIYANNQLAELLGRPRQSLMGEELPDLLPGGRDSTFHRDLAAAVAAGGPTRIGAALAGRSQEVSVLPSLSGITVHFRDRTDEARAASQLAEAEERFRLIARSAADAVWDWDLVSDAVWWGSGMQALFGHAPEELEPGAESWIRRIHPADRGWVEDSIRTVIDGAGDEWAAEYRFQRGDGSYATVTDRGFVIRDGAGVPRRMLGGMRDVTEQRLLQDQVRQGQRLEALGQLTGGVAHDFNNLLTVILGNAELLKDELVRSPELHELADMTATAARRGAELTRSLLAFARRQALEPRPVDVNALVLGMSPLLARTLGQHVAVEHRLGTDAWPALVDASQLEVALLNLAINSRDAMGEGGVLTVSSANVVVPPEATGPHGAPPGEYVRLSVADTGTGIAPEHLGRVFDPFFTTKDVGAGSGLGLSMVYGFATQSRGHVAVESEPGSGTVVHLHLPRSPDPEHPDAPSERPPGGDETILLVEDEPLVRRYAADQLAALGYRVLTTGDAAEALGILRGRVGIDLLFTDVFMPGMNGRQLAEAARGLRPGMPVLLTSGHVDGAAGPDDPLPLLPKPYERDALARSVREALGTPR